MAKKHPRSKEVETQKKRARRLLRERPHLDKKLPEKKAVELGVAEEGSSEMLVSHEDIRFLNKQFSDLWSEGTYRSTSTKVDIQSKLSQLTEQMEESDSVWRKDSSLKKVEHTEKQIEKLYVRLVNLSPDFLEKLAVRMTDVERTKMSDAFLRASEQEYRELIFGDKNPTPNRLNQWLRNTAGKDMESEEKILVAKAVQYVLRSELKGTLLYLAGEEQAPVPCTLGTYPMPHDYGIRFRVRESGGKKRTLSARKSFPPLHLG